MKKPTKPSTLEEWIAVNRPDDWLEESSNPEEVICGTIEEMEEAWKLGAIRFGKIPVQYIAKKGQQTFYPRTVGVVRSILDPEPPMEGAEFILAWFDGSHWHWDDAARCDFPWPSGEAPSEAQALEWARALKDDNDDYAKAAWKLLVDEFRKAAKGKKEDPLEWSLQHALAALNDGDNELALAIAFQVGRDQGRDDTLRKVRPAIKASSDLDRSGEWSRMVAEARARYAPDLTPVQLLKRMGGMASDEGNIRFWIFDGGHKVDQVEFQKAYNLAKKRKDSESAAGEV